MKKTTLLNVLIFFPLLSEIIGIVFLPPKIPIHYNSNLEVTSYGSKYMVLVIGTFVICFGLFMKKIYKSTIDSNTEQVVYIMTVIGLLICNIINIFALGKAFF